MPDQSPLKFKYRFSFPEGKVKEFHVQLDRQTCSSIPTERNDLPEWTRLGYKQCEHCPLDTEEHTHCPVAVSVVEIVEFFQDSQSVDKVSVEVKTPHRVSKREDTSLVSAVSSLLGLHMVTSGCPILDKLRPMARFHLPFSNTEETVYRALSMYALAQYFRHKNGKSADWNFEYLKKTYQDVNILNINFANRLSNESISEATTNAITSLDCFAQEIDFSISEGMLDEIEGLFNGYLED